MPSLMYPHLFSPLRIGSLTLPNRVVMAPMSTNLGSRDGRVTPEQIAFYRARAEGGTGMIIVEFCCVQRSTGRSEERQLSLESPGFLDGHQRLVEAINTAGAVACLQLQHGGPGVPRSLVDGGVAVGPDNVVSRRDPAQLTARALTHDEIEELIECFGRTAALAVKAGYQAIELHGAHGYLITSFLSPLMNHRTDEWGGDRERRLNFPLRVIKRVKEAIGDRPLSFRLSADEFSPEGNSFEDMKEIAPRLVEAGADMLHVSIGLGLTSFDKIIEPMSMPEGWRLPYAQGFKEVVDVPVISVGQIRWPGTAEKALADGSCDLIALGRPLLADPAWANKAKQGEAFRPCTSCNYCLTMSDSDVGHIGCAENPRAGRELEPALSAGKLTGENVVVVGGGPGGMASALLLEQAGFKVHLMEAREALGGGLIASAAPPHKDKFHWYTEYLLDRLKASSIQVYTNVTADLAFIQQLKPKAVFLANGGLSLPMDIKGIHSVIVRDAYELLMGDETLLPEDKSQPVMVYGGGETGCECAEYLAERGYSVNLVSRSPVAKLARSAEMIYRGVLLGRLRENPLINILDNSHVEHIADNGDVLLKNHEGFESTVYANRLFIAQGRSPDTELSNALFEAGIAFTLIGDARKGGRIGDAVQDAYSAVKSLCASVGHSGLIAAAC